ncbi:uncharacterized protein LOC133842701 [Drosophila sulfurigaster albostrigata]|uniref:uncharacterized protein LOC133842701 n=1 Tax=Drosophila sulfurigaster albostrigata TaxID=89887 RepID=UPI002D21EBD8|nr:uncharacterized protein LOC133842701 [Drosophila sulfurigaster albostrigata]
MTENLASNYEELHRASMRFLTGSTYEGSWNEDLHMMDGFGSYRFPDGSEYRGRFVQGKFHGYGHLKLALPYRFTIKGEFVRGKLVSIDDMWFNDGLHVEGSFQNGEFLCDEWKYLTPQDRRYQAERFYGQQPVGPTSYLTNNLLARTVPDGCYDVEEGIFNADNGWLLDRQPPFSKSVYVNCPKERSWIKRHCRGAHKQHVIEPLPDFCRKIVGNNLATEESQLTNITLYTPKKEVRRERYYPKLCKAKSEPDRATADFLFAADRPKNAQQTITEVCIRRHHEREQKEIEEFTRLWERSRPGEPLPPLHRARDWTSTSDPENVDSGATQTVSESPSEVSLVEKTKDNFDSAFWMAQKKAGDNLYVVQSYMKRPASFIDINRSVFEL